MTTQAAVNGRRSSRTFSLTDSVILSPGRVLQIALPELPFPLTRAEWGAQEDVALCLAAPSGGAPAGVRAFVSGLAVSLQGIRG